MTAFCGPVVPLEKNIITGSSPVTARSVVAGSDGRRSESVCSSFHDIVLTPPVEIDVNSSFTITVYKRRQFNKQFNPFKGTLKPHSNGPLYSITVVGTLAVDGWAVTQRGGAWAGCPPPVPSSLYQMHIADAFADHFRKTCTSFSENQNSHLRSR